MIEAHNPPFCQTAVTGSAFTHLGLFEGIGGFSLAAHWMGWKTLAWCEWNEFGQRILKHHFPNAEGFGDITKTDFTKYANRIDILTGGFPCQPFSTAGKRKGTDDERYLWGEMLRAIQEIKPKFVIAENVFGITNIDGGLVFEQVCLDLESEGYEVQPFIIPACAKNAPHRRDRVWFIAHSINGRHKTGRGKIQQTDRISELGREAMESWQLNRTGISPTTLHPYSTSIEGQHISKEREGEFNRPNSGVRVNYFQEFPTQSPICSGDDGIPTELDGITFSKWRAESIKGYGNAIVPQVAYEIFKSLETVDWHFR